jgi:serine/threonine protein kinase
VRYVFVHLLPLLNSLSSYYLPIYIHIFKRCSIIHTDLKPENILLSPSLDAVIHVRNVANATAGEKFDSETLPNLSREELFRWAKDHGINPYQYVKTITSGTSASEGGAAGAGEDVVALERLLADTSLTLGSYRHTLEFMYFFFLFSPPYWRC